MVLLDQATSPGGPLRLHLIAQEAAKKDVVNVERPWSNPLRTE